MGGAARYAYDNFGAEWGNGVGPQGQCYAIPTMHGPLSEIKPYVDDFIEYARQHPMNRFLLTRIGCGIAGFKDEQIAPLFLDAFKLPNVSFPVKWFIQFIDYNPLQDREEEKAPPVINDSLPVFSETFECTRTRFLCSHTDPQECAYPFLSHQRYISFVPETILHTIHICESSF